MSRWCSPHPPFCHAYGWGRLLQDGARSPAHHGTRSCIGERPASSGPMGLCEVSSGDSRAAFCLLLRVLKFWPS